jgi:hypothetical protein
MNFLPALGRKQTLKNHTFNRTILPTPPLLGETALQMATSPLFSLDSIERQESRICELLCPGTVRYRFHSSTETRQTRDGAEQRQPVLHFSAGKREIAFTRGEYEKQSFASLHTKIHDKLQSQLKGQGLGSLCALAFAWHLLDTENVTLVSSRSNSLDALALWQRLARHGFARAPQTKEPDLNYLLNNSTREKLGLGDKFSIWPESFFDDLQSRFQILPDVLRAQKPLQDFFQARYEGPVSP